MIYMVLRDNIDEYERHTLQHWGIKGQKWGIRRYENEDGTLTAEGKERYHKDAETARKEITAASKNPASGVGVNEAAAMRNAFFFGRKYQKLGRTIDKSIKKEVRDYNNAYAEKVKAAKDYGRSDDDRSFLESLFYNKDRAKSNVRELNEEHKRAGARLADAIASVGVQYIKDNFSEREQERVKAWIYATYVQRNDREIKNQFVSD